MRVHPELYSSSNIIAPLPAKSCFLLLPYCLLRLWQIMLQYETFMMGRKRDPYLENSLSPQAKVVRKW